MRHDCQKAHTMREVNGDVVCCGLHYDEDAWCLNEHDVPDYCRECGAWHVNWNEKFEEEKQKGGK